MNDPKSAQQLAHQAAEAVKGYVEAKLHKNVLETARLLGRIELRLRALEQLTGQTQSVDELIDKAVERAAVERVAGEIAREEAQE